MLRQLPWNLPINKFDMEMCMIRPQIPSELIDMCRVCTSVTPGEPQVWIGSDKAFTFDHVYDIQSVQDQVYDSSVYDLIEGCFDGFNATVLAYGQTGSGKTYTMGTGFDVNISPDELGIVPRAVEHLFSGINERRKSVQEAGLSPPEFKVNAQFMELYNEEIIDLLDTARDPDIKAIQCLKIGALSRTTASTQMNAQSSRSHAIFTLHIKQQRVIQSMKPEAENENEDGTTQEMLSDFETLTAKFHFVDLAGSERLKRTGATGDRAKEGISINCGLLALGNVISALGDKNKKSTHVPYRDSKLTRLLQDSLGGNSRTLMIACISPSDRDFMETLNTLKYANRAKNIRNKIVANQDKTSKTIAALRLEIQQLQLELIEYKQGKRVVDADGVEGMNDMYHENNMLQTECNNLRMRVKAMQETIDTLTARNTQLLAEMAEHSFNLPGTDGEKTEMSSVIQCYLKEIEELRSKLMESESLCQHLRKAQSRPVTAQHRISLSPMSPSAIAMTGQYDIGFEVESENVVDILQEAKKDVEKLKSQTKKTKSKITKEDKMDLENGNENQLQNQEDGLEENSDEMGNENDEEDNSGDDDDSSDPDSENKENYGENLAELSCEITIKQKLIEELERSQLRLQTMKQQYEDKMMILQQKIMATEQERDKVLSNLGSKSAGTDDKAKKIKIEYQKKLNNLQNDMKKMQSAKKEHARLLRSQLEYERQLRTLKNEVSEMKRMKVQLMNKIKEASTKHKNQEQERNREISKLKKQSRVRDNQIRTLESDKRMKEVVLKRKQEEVQMLRKKVQPLSDKVAGRNVKAMKAREEAALAKRRLIFSPKVAKQRWQHLEKDISKLAMNKQVQSHMEKEMEQLLTEREKLSHRLEKLLNKRDKAILEQKDEDKVRGYEEEIENIKTNVNYIHERITECQANIMQVEESKEDIDIQGLVNSLQHEETRYLLEKILNLSINQSLVVAQKEASLKDTETKMAQVVQSNALHQQLLQHVLDHSDLELYNFVTMNAQDEDANTDSGSSTRSQSPTNDLASQIMPAFGGVVSESVPNKDFQNKADKARRRTATHQELLYVPNALTKSENYFPSLNEESWKSYDAPDGSTGNGLTRVPSAPGSLKAMQLLSEPSPIQRRKQLAKLIQPDSPKIPRKISYSNLMSSRQLSYSVDLPQNMTPPSSPPVRRRENNVFSRLTNTVETKDKNVDHGKISIYSGKPVSGKSVPLICSHVAEGHTRAVLSVVATNDLLFSSSKDRTVKMWDLHRGQEIQSLSGHPNNVAVVKYSEPTHLCFSVSTSYIKVWDIRTNPSTCVKTLSSSGLTTHGPMTLNTPSRTLQVPPGETQINDIALNSDGNVLFLSCRKLFHCVGKLSGGHQAPVMCLAVDNLNKDNISVITGSKDHYIKVFEVSNAQSGVHTPKLNLEPPHYDGIQSLAIRGDYLFSGSRDMCIKKWDLANQFLVQSLNQAHKDWICDLNFPTHKQCIAKQLPSRLS
ncbi:Kinesin-like protein KIF21A [Nymphon striatum]|nr:Kinesin-like protein KIF21A [Nymphon striatum]